MKHYINNPYQSIEGYNCFGCSSENEFGLKLKFYEEGEFLYCKWQPEKKFEGWMGILHGGIQASLLDEIGSWVVFVKIGCAGVTAELNVKYKKAVNISTNKPILLKSWIDEIQRNVAYITAELYDADNQLCTKANMKYFIFDEKTSKDKFFYPGREAFYRIT